MLPLTSPSPLTQLLTYLLPLTLHPPTMFSFSKSMPLLHEMSSEYIKSRLKSAGLPVDGNKQVIFERLLGHWLLQQEQDAINEAQHKKYLEEEKKTRERKRVARLTDEERDAEFPTWKQCSECAKWRALPHDILPEKLGDNWVCSMNSFDSEHNSCSKSEVQCAFTHQMNGTGVKGDDCRDQHGAIDDKDEDGTDKVEDSATEGISNKLVWVQCEDCEKWRALPHGTDPNELPDKWTCSLNTMDPDHDNCDKSEEDQENLSGDEEDELEDENGFTEADKAEILKKFKAYKIEIQEKAAARAEREEAAAKERLQRMKVKQDAEFEVWASKLTASQKAAGKRVASKRSERGMLPIHKYPYYMDEAKACKQLRRDLHYGIDVNTEDDDGFKAIYHAHMNHYDGYVELLLAAGAEDDEYHLECDDYYMSMDQPRRKKVKDEWGIDKFL